MTWELILLIALLALFLIIGGVISIIIFNRVRWPYKWELYEEVVPNRLTRVKKGRARLISFGDGGEEIFFLRGIKKYRAAYGNRVEKNIIAWAKGKDGYWYNFTFKGIDKALMEVGVNPVDRDMRLANATIRKGMENRYDQKSFMDKYGTMITFGMLFICILALGGTLWITMDKLNKAQVTGLEVSKTNKEVMDAVNKALVNLNNIKTGGSGLISG